MSNYGLCQAFDDKPPVAEIMGGAMPPIRHDSEILGYDSVILRKFSGTFEYFEPQTRKIHCACPPFEISISANIPQARLKIYVIRFNRFMVVPSEFK